MELYIPAEFEHKCGYIDKYGKWIIKPQFDWTGQFRENGLAVVELSGKWGYIDHTNSFVITPYYGQVASFKDGYADVYLNGNGWQREALSALVLYKEG